MTGNRGGAIAATPGALWYMHLFYQDENGDVFLHKQNNDKWVGTSGAHLLKTLPFTPLAAISWLDGKQVRLYYADKNYILQEHCYMPGKGDQWVHGSLGKLSFKVAQDTAVAAIRWHESDVGNHLRVYCQEHGSNEIKELCYESKRGWYRGMKGLPVALSGSSLAATTYWWKDHGRQIRLYYQAGDLSLKEHCYSQHSWFNGEFNPGKAPSRAPISALGWEYPNHGIELEVYWTNKQNEIVQLKNTGYWGSVKTIVGGLKPGSQLAVGHWLEKDKYVRLYYQAADGSIVEQ
ncbi:hypothetical protein M422DRAFT_202147, partial [Sphaerobolus stellatus SS14]